MGTDCIEIDVHQTMDSVLVVIHDEDIDRTTGGSGMIDELTFNEIRSHSAGRWFDPQYSDEKVPSLQEVLDLVRGRTRLLIEIKGGGKKYPGIEKRIIEAIYSRDARNWCAVQSFHNQTLMTLHRMDSTLSLHKLIMFDLPVLPVYFDKGIQFGGIRDYNFVEAVNLNRRFVSEAFVSMLHRNGFKVHVWTVNDSLEIVRLFQMGVDGVITDFPNILEGEVPVQKQ